MKFKPGFYYVGDPGFVLPNNDLREIFGQSIHNNLKPGVKSLIASERWENNKLVCDYYWIALTPYKSGTLYDQKGNGWGFDWGCFGIVPWEWITCSGSYNSNKVDFTQSFACSFNDENITIGHLQFTFNPPK